MRFKDDHFYSFDIIRAVAAIAVVVLHWGEFTVPGFRPPFAEAFEFFYKFGALAVPLFFVLSGFVFDWLYAPSIKCGAIDASSFFLLRFSRLYPLFLVTFVVVGIEFLLTNGEVGYSFDGLYVDGYHALLTATMTTGWGFEHGFSFNGPSWTVSTEVFLYGAFFIASHRFGTSPAAIAAMIVIGLTLMPISVHLAGGLVQFFAGVAAHQLFRRWSRHQDSIWIVVSAGIALSLTLLYAYEYHAREGLTFFRNWLPHANKLERRYQIARDLLFPALVFPLFVFTQAAFERKLSFIGNFHKLFFTWCGNISYSLYLWHYPLMIGFAILAKCASLTFAFYLPTTFASYFAVLFAISHLSFYHFERPMMLRIRNYFKTRQPQMLSPEPTGVATKSSMR